jgi:uncharacterized membrane protein YccC
MATQPVEVRPWAAFRRALTRFDEKKIAPEIAIRNTIGFTAALTLASIFISPSAGVLAGIGALNVSYSDSRDPYIVRGRRMLLSSVLCALAVTLGALSGYHNGTAVIAATLWAFASGMMVAIGATAGDLGVITLVTIVVFAARPLPLPDAVESGLISLAGSLLQTVLSIALWPIRRYEPERRIVASLYEALASMARTPATPSAAPPFSHTISDARDALTSLGRDHGAEAERLVFLLNQAERIRLSLLTLGRLTRRIGRDEQGRQPARLLEQIQQAAALELEWIAHATLEGRPAEKTRLFAQAAGLWNKREWTPNSAFFSALLRDARQQIDALGGQIRSASRIAENIAINAAPEPPRRTEQSDSGFARLATGLAQLRANISFQSTAFRHALRMAICLGIGDALGRAVTLQRTYWIPMTIAIVLKPDFTATVSRGVLRIAGTFAGLILATALFHFVHAGLSTDIVLMALFVFVLRWIGPANYGIFVTALSAMIVLLLASTGISPKDVISARAINTAAGGTLALIAYGIWPTWEKTQTGAALADMLEAYRDYFRAVMDAYTGGPSTAVDEFRVIGRRARSNAEASVDRLGGEPGVTQERLNALNAILVNSHSFIHAAMALESGLYQTKTAPARAATLRFAEKVQDTFAALAGALRSSYPVPDLPDLRAAHNEIIESGEATPDRGALDRYTLVNVETDRLTTSLNTLSENVRKLLSLGRQ